MFIRSFRMDGFGIYADVAVENLAPGLTIFLGENEAGKSTCMEFLRTMLTGYPDPRSREARMLPPPLRGGQAGGSLLLETAAQERMRLTRRPGANGGTLSLTAPDGSPLEADALRRLLFGVSREVYRQVFGFSLTELEDVGGLSGEGVRNALYGASFGPGLRSPGEALALLGKRADAIFRGSGSKPPLNRALSALTELRVRKADLEQEEALFDALSLELEGRRKELAALRADKHALEEERRQLERRLGVWRQWNEWRLAGSRLERLPQEEGSVPEDGRERLAQAREAREQCERQWAALKEKLDRLKQRRDSLRPDPALLDALPELRRLAERKSGYRQARDKEAAQAEALCRAGDALGLELERLGPDWTCDRIRATDRSIFAREDLERQARDMNAAASAHQAAVDSLNLCNRDEENAEREVAAAEAALALLPTPVAELDDAGRDALRQALARQEETRRQRPLRQQAAQEAETTFARAYRPLRLSASGDGGPQAAETLDALLARQEEALALAEEVQGRMREAEQTAQRQSQAEERAAAVKGRMDALRKEWRADGASRDSLDAQTSALRRLRGVSANIEAERERQAELTARIANEPAPPRVRSVFLLVMGIAILLGGAAMLLTVWRLGPLTLPLTETLALPVDLWSGYLLLLCGVGFLAGALPHNGAEAKRRRQDLLNLQSRRDVCAQHVAELESQAGDLCLQAGIDSMDLITIEAREVLLEHEREQCFQEERARKDMADLQAGYDEARAETSRIQAERAEVENAVQRSRRRWHEFMLSLHVATVPAPEAAAAFFARAESARLAWGAVAAASAELQALDEEDARCQADMRALACVTERLAGPAEGGALADAARQVLEACREADAARERRIKAEATLQNATSERRRAGARQAEAQEELRRAQTRLDAARAAWQEALRGLGLGEGLTPETVREAFKCMDNSLAAEAAVEQAKAGLGQIRAELAALRDPLEILLARLGREPVMGDDAQPDWLSSLDAALHDATEAARIQESRRHVDGAVADAEDECHAAEAALQSARSAERGLLALAGAGDADEFLRKVNMAEERRQCVQRRQDLEDALRLAAGATPFEAFLAAFENADQNAQERRFDSIGEELAAMRGKEELLAQNVAGLAARVDAIAHTDELAQLRQREAALVSEMERMAADWSRLALARSLLDKARRVYERERQPEVIRQASRIFARITAGRWQGIGANLEDASLMILPRQGEPVLPDSLSRGAREQAYLALRLAYIANHAAHAEALPVIMDEVLVNFDPQRAERTARAFVDLGGGEGGTHQIFYFTCHPHMAELLRRAEPHAALLRVEDGRIRPEQA